MGRMLVLAVVVSASCKPQREAPPAELAPATVPAAQTPTAQVAPPVRATSCQPGARTCVRDDVVQCRADGSLGDKLESCRGACRDGACADTCALQDVELIYVIDRNGVLFSFDPKKLPEDPFRRVATLECDTSSTVNSMAVDRVGIAWLGYHNGKIHRASIIDGHCSASIGAPRGAPKTFGMGFVTDGPKTNTERLFLAGGPDDMHPRSLAKLDLLSPPPTWSPVAPITIEGDHPELTGTGDGRVYAYFPSPGRGFVQELDRRTAKPVGTRWNLEGDAGHVSAYAFAQWGGVFYVFTTADGKSSVRAIHMKSGKQEVVRDGLPNVIVGAGVSTCAPLLERAP